MKAKPSRTTNRIHFTDLDPIKFEDLCLGLIFPLHPWLDIRHYGRTGADGGVDIYAKEQLENGVNREWYVQCRRYSQATAATLKKAVDDALSQASKAPDVLLVVLACNVRRSAHEAYVKYSASKGVSTPLLWTASILEARLYAERRDLLFSCFGISTALEARCRETTISRNISMKKRLCNELLKNPKEVDWQEARRNPPLKFNNTEVIIRSIDDSSYPVVDKQRSGISAWFKLEIWDFYYNGLEFIVCINEGIEDAEGRWAVISYDQKFDKETYKEIRMFRVARIPYRNIVDIDVMGDEYGDFPHIYCRFANGGEPYEGFKYILVNDDYPQLMRGDLQFELKG